MRKRYLFLLALLIPLVSIGQLDVKPNYTKPFFQGSVKVQDTLDVVDRIRLADGSVIQAENGRGAINLRNFGVDGEVNVDCEGFGVFAGEFGVSPFLGILSVSGTAGTTLSLTNGAFTKIGQISVVNNEGQDATSGVSPGYPTILSSQSSTAKDGVINSNILGGLGVIAKTDNTAYGYQFGFNRGEAFETILDYTTATQDNTFTIPNISGIAAATSQLLENTDITTAADRTINLGSNNFLFSRTTGNFGFGVASPVSAFDVSTGTTGGAFSLYLNEVGGSLAGRINSIEFYANDSDGDRQKGNINIQSRVESLTATTVNTSLTFGNTLKVDDNEQVYIGNAATTKTPIALLHVKGLNHASPSTVLIDGNGTGTQVALQVRNSSSLSLLQLNCQGRTQFNLSNLTTGDFSIRGLTNNNLFYTDASQDAIGIGLSTPSASSILDVTSITKGFLKPRQTEGQRDAIVSPADGLEIYNTSENEPNYYNGTEWRSTISGIEGFFIDPIGSFGTGAGWADEGFIDLLPVLLFTNVATERAIYMNFAATRFDVSTIDPVIKFAIISTDAPVTTTSDEVRWQLTVKYIAEGESPGKAADETLLQTQVLTINTANTRQSVLSFTLDHTLITNQDIVHMNLERIGGDAADDYSGDVGVGQAGILFKTTNHN